MVCEKHAVPPKLPTMPRRIPSRRPVAVAALALLLGVLSCSDGPGITDPEFDARVEVSFAVATDQSGLFADGAVDGLRVTVLSGESRDTLAALSESWSSDAADGASVVEWSSASGPLDVVVEVELLEGSDVGWSGRFESGRVTATVVRADVVLFRGPLTNLDLEGVEIDGAPSAIEEGGTVQLTAAAAGDEAGEARIYWHSTDPDVATVAADGTVSAVAPGSASILAVAGPALDSVPIQVDAVPASLLLEPSAKRLESLGKAVVVAAAVVDVRGDTLSGYELLWESTDSTVLEPRGAGDFEGAGNGQAEVVATLVGRPAVSGRVTVEVDQAVATVEVSPAGLVVAGLGSTAELVATPFDANGNAIQGVDATWSSSDAAVAVVDDAGLLTAAGQGIVEVEAVVEGVAATTEVTVLGAAGVTSVWVGGDAAGARDWGQTGNWLPRRVPTLSDTVVVEAAIIHQPRLDSDRSVGGMLVEDGAEVELAGFVLTVTADLDAGKTLVGPGTVRMVGDGASIAGAVPDLVVNGSMTTSGGVTVTGDLTVTGAGAELDVGAHGIDVSGELRVWDGAAFAMTDPGGVVVVDGDAVFDGASTSGLLTAGELRVRGNFTAWTSVPDNYRPSGSHRTVLDGGVIQTVYLHHGDDGESRFAALEVDNPGGVALSSTVRVVGDVTLTSGTLSGAQTMVIGGDLVEAVGRNQYQVLNTTFTGTPSLPLSLQTTATFTGAWAATSDLEILGGLVVRGAAASFDVGGATVRVTGSFSTLEGGTLRMQDPVASLEVDGEAYFDGGSTLGLLTDGTLRVAGDFTAWNGHPTAYAPTGAHRTVLDGSAAQGVYLDRNGPGESRFHDLEVDNASGVTLFSTTRITGDLVLTAGIMEGSQTVYLDGDLVEVMAGNQYRVLNITFTGTPSLPASVMSNVTFAGAHSLSGDLDVLGDLMVVGPGATLAIGGHAVTVTGDFRTASGGALSMTGPGVLDVEGEAEFNGGSTLGLLTAGELRVAGDFTAWTSDPENFAPSASHATVLDGTTGQGVYLYHTGVGESGFGGLEVTNPAGATLLGTTRISGDLTVASLLRVDTGQAALVEGLFTLESSATLANDGSVQANSCLIQGTVTGNPVICP